MRLGIGPAMVLALIVPVDGAPAAQTISKTEIRSDPPAVTDRRLRDQFWDLFEKEDLRTTKPPANPLQRLWFTTRSRGTEVPGLCRRDSLIVEFAPVARPLEGADTATRPVGFTSRSSFVFLSPPKDEYDEIADRERLPSDTACSGIARDDPRRFTASDAQSATNGVLAFLKLQRALARKAAVPLACDLFPSDKVSCAALLLALRPESIGDVASCDSDETGIDCFEIAADDRRIRIFMSREGAAAAAEGVVRASLESLIVMWHQVPD